jgi:hypothetical protein
MIPGSNRSPIPITGPAVGVIGHVLLDGGRQAGVLLNVTRERDWLDVFQTLKPAPLRPSHCNQ